MSLSDVNRVQDVINGVEVLAGVTCDTGALQDQLELSSS